MIEEHGVDLCFAEPKSSQDRETKRSSTPPDWLRTADTPFARAMRRYLNENIAQLPESFQSKICNDLKKRWDSAYFELIVARTLQLLGATIEVEPESEAGTRIDFHAQFVDTAISIEAILPTFNVAVEVALQNREPLIGVVEALAPSGWSVFVRSLPRIGHNDKKDNLKRVLREMFAIAPPSSDSDPPIELDYEMETGVVDVTLYPRRAGWPVVAGSSHNWWGNDSVDRIRRSVRAKREQAKNASLPTILAVGAGIGAGIVSHHAFIDALYGERTAVLDLKDEMHDEFSSGGAFMQVSSDPPTFAGLLAFPIVGITRVDQPVLFLHPSYSGVLPEALLALEQYSFDPRMRQVSIHGAQCLDVLAGLNLVPDIIGDETP